MSPSRVALGQKGQCSPGNLCAWLTWCTSYIHLNYMNKGFSCRGTFRNTVQVKFILRLCHESYDWKFLLLVLQVPTEHQQVGGTEKANRRIGCDPRSKNCTLPAFSQVKQPDVFYRTRSATIHWWLQNRQVYMATTVLQWSTFVSCWFELYQTTNIEATTQCPNWTPQLDSSIELNGSTSDLLNSDRFLCMTHLYSGHCNIWPRLTNDSSLLINCKCPSQHINKHCSDHKAILSDCEQWW